MVSTQLITIRPYRVTHTFIALWFKFYQAQRIQTTIDLLKETKKVLHTKCQYGQLKKDYW